MSDVVRLLHIAGAVRKRTLLAICLGALTVGCAIGLFAASGYLIARAAQHPFINALAVAVVAVRALAIGRAVSRYSERLVAHDVALAALADARLWFYRRLEKVLPTSLWAPGSGDVVTRMVSDVDSVQDLVVRTVVPIAVAVAVVVGVVAVVAWLSGAAVAGLLAAGLVTAGVVVPWAVARVARRSSGGLADARGEFAAEVVDDLTGADELVAFGATGAALDRVDTLADSLHRLNVREARQLGRASGLSSLSTGLTVWGVLVAASLAVAAKSIDPVVLVVVTMTAMAAFEAVQPLPVAATTLASARTAARRIFGLTDQDAGVEDPEHPVPVTPGAVTVALSGARARYGPGLPYALDGVSFVLTPGRRVALVGPSGAGKSTAIAALLRLVVLESGMATLDGRSLTDYSATDVHRAICGVTQDPYIFATSLEANLRIGRPQATDDEVTAAIGAARLTDWVGSLPSGRSTQLGPSGVRVSGGERQRIALARALLADPPVLVLDEPTAHLDEANRAALIADLLDVTAGRTTLIATHDLAGLDEIDEILVLDRGRIVQRGSHHHLVSRPGLYRDMFETQIRDSAA